MKTPNKLRGARKGATVPALSRLKELCRKKPEAGQEIWGWRDDPETTNAAIRGQIEARFGFRLLRDSQLSEFWSWLDLQLSAQRRNDRMSAFEEALKRQDKSMTVEQVRNAGIALFMTDTVMDEDLRGFLGVAKEERAERQGRTKFVQEQEKIGISKEKLKLLQRNAEAMDKLKAEAGRTGGGISKETFEQVTRDLNLL